VAGGFVEPPRRLLKGVERYGIAFAGEVLLFWIAVLVFQAFAYPLTSTKLTMIVVIGFPIVTVALGFAEATFRLYRRVWAVASTWDAMVVGFAVAEAAAVVTISNALLPEQVRPYRLLVPILAAPMAALALGAFRLLPRLLSTLPAAGNRILFVAEDSTDYATIKSMLQKPGRGWVPVGILTTAAADVRRTVMGTPILGRSDDLTHWIEVTRPDGVAFVLDGHPADHHDQFNACLAAELPIFILPAHDELFHGPNGLRLREVTADDLVGRSPRDMDVGLARDEVADKTVLITGAAGSIGSELCRVVVKLRPRRLILLDNNESGLFDLCQELRMTSTAELHEILLSITDEDLLARAFLEERPDIVFHAAAYKHVPMLENWPIQAVLTNVIGTRNTIRAAAASGTARLVLVSTDKAVAHHSILGCSKRLCEMMILAYSGPMRCWAVRFGNVVGSRGSVVPTFERQIRQGGPVTITHPEASRYMMTIREAVSLVITTLHIAGPGALYSLDMGRPIKILTLAEALIRARGLRPNKDIEIVYTGLRPGEVVTEQLLSSQEAWRPSPHPAIHEIVSPTLRPDELEPLINRLQDAASQNRGDDVRSMLKQSVLIHTRPEFVKGPESPAPVVGVPAWLYED